MMLTFIVGFASGALSAFLAAALIAWWSERDLIAYVDNEDTEQ